MRRLLPLLLTALLILGGTASAHIGTLNVIYDGLAGNIPVRVIIRPPGVVPGLAEIDVRVLTNGVQKVTVLPVHWRAGLEGAPPPDVCQPVPGDAELYHAELWLMASGAYSVHVQVETTAGSGKVIVPVNSLATTRLEMSPGLTIILIALGMLLFGLAVSVAGAAVRESVIDPGLTVSRRRQWLGRGATVAAAAIIGLALYGGKAWWDSVDRDYRSNRMFKPVPVTANARWDGDRQVLRLEVDEAKSGNTWGPLVPDHGKLMHLFLIRTTDLKAFAHLHPIRRSSKVFESALPTLPPGEYRAYADVTHENGFAQTLFATVNLTEKSEANPPSGQMVELDSDDSFLIEPTAPPAKAERIFATEDGLTIKWEEPSEIRAATPSTLRFRVFQPGGKLAELEAYMGMLSHLIISRDDGSVFTHLHPAGSISMASQQVFQLRAGEKPPKRITPEMMEKLCQPPGPEMLQQPVTFPYEFPKPGRYKIWIQVKVAGQVQTATFETLVTGPES